SANSEFTTLLQVSNLIAAASISGTGNTFRVSAADTTSKFAEAAILGGGLVSAAVNNPGGNETLTLTVTAASAAQAAAAAASSVAVTPASIAFVQQLVGKRTDVSTGTTAATAFNRYRITGTATVTLPTFAADEWIIVEFAVGVGETGTVGRNSQTIDGASEDD